MKKFLLSLILLLSVSLTSTKAQGHFEVLSYGLKAGVNFTSLSPLPNVYTGLKAGFTGGLYAELRPVHFLGISGELLYSSNTYDAFGGHNNQVFSAELSFLDIPILAKIYLYKGFSVNVGIMPSVLLDSNFTVVSTVTNLLDFQPTMLSIPLGVSYLFDSGISFDFRYRFAVTNAYALDRVSAEYYDELNRARGESFSLTIGIRL